MFADLMLAAKIKGCRDIWHPFILMEYGK